MRIAEKNRDTKEKAATNCAAYFLKYFLIIFS